MSFPRVLTSIASSMLTTFAFFNLDVAPLSTVKLIATTDYAHVAGTGRVPNLSFFSTKILLKQKCKNYINVSADPTWSIIFHIDHVAAR